MKRKRFLSGLLTVAMLCSMFLPIGTQAAPTPTPIKAADGLVNEDNAAFLWTGTWADQTASDRHGGASKWTNTDGSAVEVLFEGQGITFYSTKRADAGEYKVYLDGVYQGKGTLKADPLPKQIAYSVFGLENGVHTLKICTVGAVILEADAAEVLSTDPNLTTAVAVTAAGDAEKITAPGGTLQMTATTVPAAQSVRWTVTDGKGAPTTAASIDGTGLLTAKTNGVVLVTATATDGSLKSGTKPVSISGQTVGGEKWDDQDARLTYGAGWGAWNQDPLHYNGTTMYSNGTPGNTLTFSFAGTGFKVIGLKNAALSSFSVSVDGTEVAADVSANGAQAYQQELYVSGTLTDGTHQVVITDKGQIYIDAIEISYAPPAIAAITAAEPLAAVEVPAGTAFEDLNLPTTVNVTAGGASVPMDIYWEKGSYNPAQAGEYNLSGVLLYGAAQDNAAGIKASITVTVSATDSAVPSITTQPQNQSVTAPAPATFTVAATSPDSGTLIYQWEKQGASESNWTKIDGAIAASYTTPATTVAADHGAKYRCVVTNTKGSGSPASATTNAATLTVTIDAAVSRITAADGTVDDIEPAFTYSSTGWTNQASVGRFGDTYRCGNAGASAEIAFRGQGISFLTTKHPGAGAFKVYVDGVYQGQGTTYGTDTKMQQTAYTVWGLADSDHTLRIECIGYVEVDAALVLTANPAPAQTVTINTQPTNQTVNEPAAATFSVAATAAGDGAKAQYQWQKESGGVWTTIADATAASYTTAATTVAADHGAKYRCVVTSSSATAAVTAISTEATLTVTHDASASKIPEITTQPKNVRVTAPAPATFTVAATSPDSGTLTYQWEKQGASESNWTKIDGATAESYTTAATTVATDHDAKYRCVVTNTKDAGKPASATTNAATLTVLAQQSIALDTATGRLKVDYAGYLSRHDVVYKSPVEQGVNGATVGTGRMGGMVWNKDGLKLEVTNVDAAPYSCIPSGLITYQSSPMPQAVPGKFEQRLNLHKGSVTTEYGDGLKFTIMGDPDSELMGIHVVDTRTAVTEAHVDLSLWLDKLNAEPNAPFGGRPGGNPAIAFPNQETWLNPKFTVRDNYVAITRGGEDPNNFGYTIALTVEGATYDAQLVGAGTDKKLRLNVDPADKEYTIWIANPSRRHAANHDTLTAAETMLGTERTYEEVYGRFTSYWDGFWNRCFAEYQSDNSDADYLENSWYLYQYLIGCGSRGEFPFHFMNGVWRGEEQDEGLWSWDYTSFNERTFSYTHYATNRLELTNSYYNLFYNNLESGKQYTIDRFWKNDKDPRFNPQREGYIPGGVLSPERHTWNGEMQVGYNGTPNGCPYTTKVNATAAEHAMGMYERYAYTGDLEYLKTKAYPFIKAVGIYLLNFLQYDSATDTYYSENSHALEQYWGVTNPITDMAAFPAFLERAIAASELLGVDADLRVMWQDRLTKLAKPKTEAASEKATAISGGANRYQPHDPPRTQQMNSQNPELDVVWPYSRVGLYQESAEGFDFATALNSYIDRKMPINIWTPEPIVSARLGLGDESFQYAVNMIARSQTKPNGIHYDGNGSLESNALILTAVGEELLQSYNDKIAVFPAVMSDPTFRSEFTLLARGGFLVSSEYEQGAVKYVSLVSQLGGKATVINPWGKGEAVTVRNLATSEVLLDSVTTLELTFDTVKDGKYVVEQDSRSLSAFLQAEAITAPRNEAPKYLSKSGRILGSKPMDNSVPITEKDVIVNENEGAFRWTGAWTEVSAGDRFGGNFRWSGTVGNSVDISFAGQGILLYSTRRADGADYEIYLDGVYQGTGSVKGGTQPKYLIFSAFGLTDGEHVVTIRHSAGSILEVDAAKVPSVNPGCVTALSLAGAGDATVITAKGGTLQITAAVDPAESPLKWTVTDLNGKATAAAEISASGLLTAKTNGVVRVTAAAIDTSLKSASIVIAISGQIEAPKVIASAASVADVSAAAGTAFSALTLPKTVGITLVGGGTAELPVLWQPGNYDPAISATYALIGTLLYGADYENPDGVTAHVNVVLGAQAPAIRSVSPVELTAGAGTSFHTLPLPATVTATLEGGATVQVSVIWDASTYDSAYVGKQHLTGTLQPNEAYTNPEKLYATAVLTTTQRSPEEVKLESKLAQARAYLPAAAKYQPDGSERLNEAISTATAAMQSGEALEQAYSQLRDAIFGLREIP